jgi:hypothetical protein
MPNRRARVFYRLAMKETWGMMLTLNSAAGAGKEGMSLQAKANGLSTSRCCGILLRSVAVRGKCRLKIWRSG